ETNKRLCENNETGTFLTITVFTINLATGAVTFANAGHDFPLLSRKTGIEFLSNKPQVFLGGFDGIEYKNHSLQLDDGDTLFLYTDGLAEARNVKEEEYGLDRLKESFAAHADKPIDDLASGVVGDLDAFTSGREQFDDLTYVAFRYHGAYRHGEISFRPERGNIESAIAFVNQYLDQNDKERRSKLAIAIDEIFSNIVKYAGAGENGKVVLTVEKTPDEIAVTFLDNGIPFNPLEQESPDVSLGAEDREIGGLGIFIVKKLMDEVTYEREGEWNKLRVVKRFTGILI
ncbi:MAG: SpoIIE family protein phosphatase, partial [Bacilli bacterium]|nr:SpoIIE family protein phosphatase [Bacilli bacterium]